jgi:hypothetical protein
LRAAHHLIQLCPPVHSLRLCKAILLNKLPSSPCESTTVARAPQQRHSRGNVGRKVKFVSGLVILQSCPSVESSVSSHIGSWRRRSARRAADQVSLYQPSHSPHNGSACGDFSRQAIPSAPPQTSVCFVNSPYIARSLPAAHPAAHARFSITLVQQQCAASEPFKSSSHTSPSSTHANHGQLA